MLYIINIFALLYNSRLGYDEKLKYLWNVENVQYVSFVFIYYLFLF